MPRVREHLAQLGLDSTTQSTLNTQLTRAYKLRNEVVHEGKTDHIDIAQVEELWSDVKLLISLNLGFGPETTLGPD
jgi:hypothetical protein